MINTKSLTKSFGDLIAVNNINLSVEKGVFYGLLGPNGAGKTTTIKMLAMLLKPDSGEIEINSELISRKSKNVKKLIGVVPQHLSLQKDMSVEDTLTLHGFLHKMKLKDIKFRIAELLVFAGMGDMAKKSVNKLSGGNKRKLMILRSVMHNPSILFLDEPTVGLDPQIRRTVWDLLKKLKTEGLTILLTTHYIEEANVLCDTIGMMSKGQLIKESSPVDFIKEIKPIVLENFDGIKTHYFYFDTKAEASNFGADLEGEVHIRKSNLEDVYVTYTNDRSFR